jgi:DNA-binding CsgD family transcriptional regulator
MLPLSTLRALSQALVELHSPGTNGDFSNRLFACLRTCFSCDFYSYDEFTENAAARIEIYPAVDAETLNRWLDRYPHIGGVYKHNGSLRIIHFSPANHWCRTEMHNDLLGLLHQKYQLGLTAREGRSRISIALSRSSHPFSEQDQRVLDLLRPHLAQAHNGSMLNSYLSEAVGFANIGFLVADRYGQIRYATARARKLLNEYFCPDSAATLPHPVQAWLTKSMKPRSLVSSPRQDLTVASGHKTLAVQTSSKPEAPEYRLCLRETVHSFDAAPLQRLGLTHREAEVLLWVSQGKSNAEIAIILASKVRTVAKHLERVFAKLMVENRTAAAHAALAALSYSG